MQSRKPNTRRLPTTFRRSLIANIVVLLLLLGGSITALQYWSARRVVRKLSGSLTNAALSQTEQGLSQFFSPINGSLELAVRWGREYNLVQFPMEQVYSLYAPFLEQVGYISSALLADESGREIMVLRRDDGSWYVREIHPNSHNQQRVLTFSSAGVPLTDRTVEIEYSPTTRRWFRGAIDLFEQAPPGSDSGEIYWTEPYEFFTTKEPGITAAKAFVAGDQTWVVAFDVLLMDISAFTTSIEVSPNGKVIVTEENGQIVGLPRDERFKTAPQRSEALLKHAVDIGLPLMRDAQLAFEHDGELVEGSMINAGAFRFESGGEPWWGEVTEFELSNRTLVIGVTLPERDLLQGVLTERFTVLGLLGLVLLLGVLRARWLGSRYAEPVEELALASDRISRLNLDKPVQIKSHVREILRLVETIERMRASLQNLLKLERDLQTARQIQQATFPDTLPALTSAQLAAYSEPADETGGDSYDLIGLETQQDGSNRIAESGSADKVLLFLADATGHGVGPALSVTQVRSMVRIGARLATPLDELAQHMNDQLSEDLSAGRFVTMWLGQYNDATGELWTFSAGQGPLLLYRSATDTFEEIPADTTPLGIMKPLEIVGKRTVTLQPGDVFVVLSDGIYEAAAEDNSMFNRPRVEESIRKNAGGSAQTMLDALREDVRVFKGGCPARDDETGIIIKRIS